jgi:hypothetical protein
MEERRAVGFIRPLTSEWAAPVTMPPKKDENGNWTLKRLCVDYRALNSKTPTDHYPLPTPKDIFDALLDSAVFTTLDLRIGTIKFGLQRRIVARLLFDVWMVCTSGL